MNNKFDFLKSTRFWALVVGAVTIYAQTKGWIGEAEMMLIDTIMGGHILVRTIDRVGDMKVEAAKQ